MGMFDTIHCSDAMPFNDDMAALGLNTRDWSFQTKDLDNVLSEYVLQNGFLYEKKYKESKWVERDLTRKPGMGNFGHIERTGEYLDYIPHHGVINMCDYREDVMGWDCYVEYAVTFTNGKATNTELTEFTKEDSAPRIRRIRELCNRMAAQRAKWYNKYIFDTAKYGAFRHYLVKPIKAIRALCDFLILKLP